MDRPNAPPPTIDLLPALQEVLPQLTKSVVEALMPEFRNEVLNILPVIVNELLANTLVYKIRNEIQNIIPIIVVETLRVMLELKREDDEANAGIMDDNGAAEGNSRPSQQPKTPEAKYSDVRVSDDEMLARFNEAKRKQAVLQTKNGTNAGVAVEVSFEEGKNGKYAGAQSEGAIDWMDKGE